MSWSKKMNMGVFTALVVAVGAAMAGDSARADLAPLPPVAQPQQAQLGQAAPDFTLTDLNGKTVKLSDYKGKIVVLEWFNPGCPYVKAAYGGAHKERARQLGSKGVIWLNINSGGAGKEGAGLEANKAAAEAWRITHPILMDESGTVGRLYQAKTTPHMYVVDAKGILVYRGALDNAPLGEVPSGATLTNYVENAVNELQANKAVTTAETKSYGCGVKYAK